MMTNSLQVQPVLYTNIILKV